MGRKHRTQTLLFLFATAQLGVSPQARQQDENEKAEEHVFSATTHTSACVVPRHPREIAELPEPALFTACATFTATMNVSFLWRPSVTGIPQCCQVTNTTRGVCLPLLNVVGFPKCGTTALHAALLLHPSLYEGRTKELGLRWGALSTRPSRGEWIQFERSLRRHPRTPALLAPGALLLNSDVHAQRHLSIFARAVPNARVVFMVRHPVDRAISSLLHSYRQENRRHKQHSLRQAMPRAALVDAVDKFIERNLQDSLCITSNNVNADDSLATIISAALHSSNQPWPSCLDGRVLPCNHPNATVSGTTAMAVQPRSMQIHSTHVACFLGAIIEAHALFGYKHVDVHWLESFRGNPAEHITSITRFFGLAPMPPDSLPQSESALTSVIKSTSGSASTFFRNAWQSKPELSGKKIGGTLPFVIDDDIKERLCLFFEPFERARRAYFAWAGLPEYPGSTGVT